MVITVPALVVTALVTAATTTICTMLKLPAVTTGATVVPFLISTFAAALLTVTNVVVPP